MTLADRSITPGAVDASVNAAMVCVPGFAKSRRPGLWAGLKLKSAAMKRYGIPRTPANWKAYTMDHLIPLELGGSPTDPDNLWPQPKIEAKHKDRDEADLHRAVCAKTVALSSAQATMVSRWSAPSLPEKDWRKG